MGIYDNLPSASPASGVTTFGQAMGNPFVGAKQVGQISGVQDPLAALRMKATQDFHDANRQMAAQKIAAGEQHASGFQGLLQDVMSNPIVKTVMKPLELLDYGRRGVISTLKETVDLIDPKGHASLSEWWNQTNDPTFGFGKIIPKSWQKNVWLGRAVGLAGDILLDPLTYVTLGGSQVAKVVGHGAEGRIVASARLLEDGVVTAERAKEIARKGIGFLTSEERHALGLGEQGIYFMGKRVAGTGSIAEAMQHGAFRARVFGGETLKMKKIVRMFDGEQVQAVRRGILDGTVPTGEAENFFHAYMANGVRREAVGRIGTAEGHLVRQTVEAFTPEELDAARNTAWRAAEGVTVGEPITAAEQRVADVFAEMQTRRIEEINAERMILDPTGQSNFGVVENHFPHVRTNEGMNYMADLHNTHARELRDVLEGPSGYEGMFKSRMVEGDKFFGKELTKEDIAGGVGRLNEIANEAGFKGKFFETDMIKAHSRYVEKYAAQRGENAFLLHLQEKGALQPILDRMVMDEDLVAQGIKDAAKASQKFGDSLEKVRQSIEDTTRQVQRTASDALDKMGGDLVKMEEHLGGVNTRMSEAVAAHSDAVAGLDEASRNLWAAHAAYEVALKGEKPRVLSLIWGKILDVDRQIKEVRGRIVQFGELRGEDLKLLDGLDKKIKELSKTEMILTEHGNRIEEMLGHIIEGTDGKAVAHLNGADLGVTREGEAVTSAKLAEQLRGAHRAAAVVDGGMEQIVKDAAKNSLWYAKANEVFPIPLKTVRSMSVPKVTEIAGRAMAGNATMEEMRAATMWMIARAEAIHGGLENLPPAMQRVLEGFVTGAGEDGGAAFFRRTAEVMKFDKFTTESDQWATRGMRLDRVRTNLHKVEREVTDFASTYIEAKMMADRVAQRLDDIVATTGTPMEDLLAMEVPLDKLVEEVGHDSPLSGIFADWIDQYDNGSFYEDLMQPDNIAVGDAVRSVDGGMAVVQGAKEAPPTLTWGDVQRALSEVDGLASSRRWTLEAEHVAGRQELLGTLESDTANVLDLGQINQDFQDLGQNLQIHFHFNKQLKSQIDARLRNGDVAGALDVVDARLKGLRQTRTALNRKIRDEFGDVALTGGEVAMTRRAAVDLVKSKLGDGMQQFWFQSQIEERWQKTLAALAPYHLVPTDKQYRAIVTQVSKEFMDSLGTRGEAARQVQAGLSKIEQALTFEQPASNMSVALRKRLATRQELGAFWREEARNAGFDISTAEGVRGYIDSELKKLGDISPEHARLLSLHNSDDFAHQLLERADIHGGARMDTADFKKLNQQRRDAGLTELRAHQLKLGRMRKAAKKLTNPDEVAAAESAVREAEQKLIVLQERQPMLEAQASDLVSDAATRQAKRDAFVADELRPWYKRVTGETSNNTPIAIMYSKLKEHVASSAGSTWRDLGTSDELLSFVQGLQGTVRDHTNSMVQNLNFYRRAADPWANLDDIMAGVHSHIMLPDGYADRMLRHADALETVLTRHEKFLLEEEAAKTAAQAAGDRATVAEKRAAAMDSVDGASAELFGDNAELAQKAGAEWRRVHNISVHPRFLQAEQIYHENELLNVLAQYDGIGGIQFKTRTPIMEQVEKTIADGGEVMAVPRVSVGAVQDWSKAVSVDAKWLTQQDGKTANWLFFTSTDSHEEGLREVERIKSAMAWRRKQLRKTLAPEERKRIVNELAQYDRLAQNAGEASMRNLVPVRDEVKRLAIDGEEVQFNPAEWDALFTDPSQKVKQAERTQAGREYRDLIAAREEHVKRIETVKDGIDHAGRYTEREIEVIKQLNALRPKERTGQQFEAWWGRVEYQRQIPRSWTPEVQADLRERIANLETELKDIRTAKDSIKIGRQKVLKEMNNELEALTKRVNAAKYRYEVHLVDTGREARKKLRSLVAKIREPDSGVSLDGIRAALDNTYKVSGEADARRAIIQGALWGDTPHKAVYERVMGIKASAEYKFAAGLRDDATAAVGEAARARAAAEEASYVRQRTLSGFQAVVKDGKTAGNTVGAYNRGVNDIMQGAIEDAQGAADMLTKSSPAPTWGVEIANLMHGMEGGKPLAYLGAGDKAAVDVARQYPQELRNVAAHISAAPADSGRLVRIDPELLAQLPKDLELAQETYKTALGAAIEHGRGEVSLKARKKQLTEALKGLQAELKSTTANWEEVNQLQLQALKEGVGSAEAEVRAAYKVFEKATSKLDAMKAVSAKEWAKGSPVQLQQNIDELKQLINEMEASRNGWLGGREAIKDAAKDAVVEKGKPIAATTADELGATQRLLELTASTGEVNGHVIDGSIGEMHRMIEEAGKVLEAAGKGDSSLMDKLYVTHYDQLLDLSKQRITLQQMMDNLPKAGEFNAQWMKTVSGVIDGWTSLGAIRLPNSQMSQELWKALYNIRKASGAGREILSFLKPYTAFFKTYSTLSPGFHVRNGISNVMQYLAAGGNPMLLKRSFGMAKSFLEHEAAGTLETFYKGMNEFDRAVFDATLKATRSAGGGRLSDQLRHLEMLGNKDAKFLGMGGKMLNNPATRLSRDFGHNVEFVGRFALAYDTVYGGLKGAARNGTTFAAEDLWQTAAARVKRFLFDYTNPSHVDNMVREIVPFWTWMSRNVPTQLANQWANPRAYAIYNSIVRNIGLDQTGQVVPQWLKEQGGIRIGGDTYLTPDWGMTRADQVLAELGDPARMGSYVNPMLRVPIELLGSRRLYNNQQFSSTPQEVTGGPAQPLIEQLLGLIGATKETGPNGVRDKNGKQLIGPNQTVTSDKWNYALLNLLPMLSQAERLAPATEGYKAKQGASWLSYLGAPVREVTQQQKDAEIAQRTKQLQQLASNAKKLGYTP